MARRVNWVRPMTATSHVTFRRLDEQLEDDETPPPASTTSELGARFWYVFDRWLAVTSSTEEEFVLA